ncbi:SlyB protein [Nubsella zeaxanthinifaciens]|uniref:SlyB protein n=1 Tax=Nubsella zeaxanthinifaciens TaxID=392412 RepID=UPI000DE20D6F|nr:SlyB protein [Nubsella zeaxanthinifaciens]
MNRQIILAGLFFASVLGACSATKSTELQKYEARQQVLELNTDRNELKIELEKERITNEKLKKDVANLNAKADRNTSNFSASDPSSTASDAKSTARLLNDVEKANKRLQKSDKKIESLQKDIEKLDDKIGKLNKQIEFVDQNKQ